MPATIEAPTLVKVAMGGVAFAKNPAVLETLLGSCVGIAVWDRTTGYGGLAHIVLPDSDGSTSAPGKFADTAVVHLRKTLVAKGADPFGFRAKMAGGAKMFGPASKENIGARNIEATIACLAEAKIPIIAQHVGGDAGRVIQFSLINGAMNVMVRREVVAVI